MESTGADDIGKAAQGLADSATDKVPAVIHGARESVMDAGNALASRVADIQDKAAPAIRKVRVRAQSTGQQSLDAINDLAGQARGMAASTADSIVSYTKQNPVTALAIAAAAGVVLYAAIMGFRSSRD
jgi:ElaB/YqjD/DUF883 family membrane-anchored ribosome-binding protein